MDDIDALKRELQQTRLAYQTATAINEFKSGFLGRIAHELRSPLSSLISLHQLILTNLCESPDEEREFVAQAHQSARKLLGMIDEVITVSKLEYGSITLDRQPLSLAKLFQDLERLTRLQAANRNLKLEFREPPADLAILADYQRLSHALVLLVDTAIAYLEMGTIRIDWENSLDRVIIQIQIPDFVTFWQESEEFPFLTLESRQEAVKQFGQNLSLSPRLKFEVARSIIETLNGEITLSEIAAGRITQIDCSLPRSPDRANHPVDND